MRMGCCDGAKSDYVKCFRALALYGFLSCGLSPSVKSMKCLPRHVLKIIFGLYAAIAKDGGRDITGKGEDHPLKILDLLRE